MTTLELMQRIVENHNRIAQIVVSGDSAILVGDTIRDLRLIVKDLQEQLQAEQSEMDQAECKKEK